jgi:alpha-ketoglutarate-dependent taurine dioxygenase
MSINISGEEKAGAKRLPTVRRRAVNVSQVSLVSTGYMSSGETLPLVIRPAIEGVNLVSWATQNRELIETELARHGAILFRGFASASYEQFEPFCRAASGELLEYRERSSPRSAVGGRVYSSTDYPPDQTIFLHNEHSYSLTFPLRLFFYCQTPAPEGGATPLADTRKVLARIDPQVRERFIEKRWMYVRNFGDGFGLDWPVVFQTTDKSAVEQYCRAAGIEVEWKSGNRLRTRQVRDAVIRHPRTGELAWFNHATFFHVSTLGPSIRQTLLTNFASEDLPNNSYYGDGTPIEPEVAEHLREAYLQELVAHPWESGDILLIDNVLTAHGRAPFAGPRKVLVAMAEPFSRAEAQHG